MATCFHARPARLARQWRRCVKSVKPPYRASITYGVPRFLNRGARPSTVCKESSSAWPSMTSVAARRICSYHERPLRRRSASCAPERDGMMKVYIILAVPCLFSICIRMLLDSCRDHLRGCRLSTGCRSSTFLTTTPNSAPACTSSSGSLTYRLPHARLARSGWSGRRLSATWPSTTCSSSQSSSTSATSSASAVRDTQTSCTLETHLADRFRLECRDFGVEDSLCVLVGVLDERVFVPFEGSQRRVVVSEPRLVGLTL